MSNFFIIASTFFTLLIFPAKASTESEEIIPQKNRIILLNTLPKSGSIFIWDTLSSITNYQKVRVSLVDIGGCRPGDPYINEDQIKKYFRTYSIAQDHVDPTKDNLQLLEKYFSKMILHLRDPRQALVSWTHYVETVPPDRRPHLPKGYFSWPFEKKIDWQIENFLTKRVKWIQDWCDVIDSKETKIKILVTHFEEMKKTPNVFFKKIAHFFNFPMEGFYVPNFSGNPALHQRKGSVDEWKTTLNKRQLKRVEEIVTQKLIDRFGWCSY